MTKEDVNVTSVTDSKEIDGQIESSVDLVILRLDLIIENNYKIGILRFYYQ